MNIVNLDEKIEYLINKSEIFCILPWIHIHLLPNGNALPCCVWPYDNPISNAHKAPLAEISNNDLYKEIRLKMLNDQRIQSCQHCYLVDASQGLGVRTTMNYKFKHKIKDALLNTNEDGSLKKFEMSYFDVRFSNLCNFKCRGCSPELSSAWISDYKKLHPNSDFSFNQLSKNEKIWNELISFVDQIEETYFAGGEPLLMEEHYKLLSIFIEKKLSHMNLNYSTNLSTLGKDNVVLSLWNHFKSIHLCVSIDDLHERGEFFRKGMDFNKTIDNMKLVLTSCPHISLNILVTVNILNIFNLTNIHLYFLQNNLLIRGKFYMNILLDPIDLRIQMLDMQDKNKITKDIAAHIKWLKKMNSSIFDLEHTVSMFESVVKFMYEERSENMNNFLKKTIQLDKIRDEDFLPLFPEFKKYMIRYEN